MPKPIRIQLSRRKGWHLPPNTVVVSRGPGRKWGNPFKVAKLPARIGLGECPDAASAVQRYPQFSKFAIWAAVSGYTWTHLPCASPKGRTCRKGKNALQNKT